jgi:hypothetical protein
LNSLLHLNSFQRKAQPDGHRAFHDGHLGRRQFAEIANQLRVRNRHKILGIENARTQERH